MSQLENSTAKVLWMPLLGLTLFCACVPRPKEVLIAGTVVHFATGEAIPGAVVDISEPGPMPWWRLEWMPAFKLRTSVVADHQGYFEVRLQSSRTLAVGPKCGDWSPSLQAMISRETYERNPRQVVQLKLNPAMCAR